ncbi:hypothetical protein AB1Y20_000055 [Prymnesium parvum]|uniref:Serine/threonine-protein phosphatase n=1 Tax=Prymnesium parvum TaxID=97485 RepID=A0AB34K4B3_PRYPA
MHSEDDPPSTQEDPPSTQEDPPSTQEDPPSTRGEAPSSSVCPPVGLPSPDKLLRRGQSSSDEAISSRDGGASALGKRKVGPSPTMSRKAEVANWHGELSRTISIDRLPQEGKRLSGGHALTRAASVHGLESRAIALLLDPRGWRPPAHRLFPMNSDELIALCGSVQELFQKEPSMLQLSAPIKVFGDIHGQYSDLMRIFNQYGSPDRETGDIQLVDYLFLGDFVDRGKHSLETLVLLLSLKIRFPTRVFLVRGNHESPEVNARDGFLHECVERLGGKRPGVAAWKRFNELFEWLPVAALINGCILCVHGGIGRTIDTLDQISQLQRPLRMGGASNETLLDLLWSDPTASDDVNGVHTNQERGAPVVCYGPDRVHSFLRRNRLSLIVRGHECVMDGFQRFAGGKLITVFSATNYCNKWANAGAILLIGKDLEVTPKLIYPTEDLEQLHGVWLHRADATAEHLQDMRPPTPPRGCGSEDDEPTSPTAVTRETPRMSSRQLNQLRTVEEGSEEQCDLQPSMPTPPRPNGALREMLPPSPPSRLTPKRAASSPL